jgi:hypothetical protein
VAAERGRQWRKRPARRKADPLRRELIFKGIPVYLGLGLQAFNILDTRQRESARDATEKLNKLSDRLDARARDVNALPVRSVAEPMGLPPDLDRNRKIEPPSSFLRRFLEDD